MPERKAQFVAWFQDRFFLRFHMIFILSLTFLAGLGVTKAFLVAGNTNLALRYGVAVAASYGAFLVLLKIWLLYMEEDEDDPEFDGLDVVEAVDDATRAGFDAVRRPIGFHGDGGRFGGGGSSGSFGESSADGVSSVVSDLDEDFGFAVVVLVALAAAACVGGYLIYAGPGILAEVAFEALLAPAMVRGVRRGETAGWLRPAMRATVVPFACMLVVAVSFGLAANEACPQAHRMAEVIACAGL